MCVCVRERDRLKANVHVRACVKVHVCVKVHANTSQRLVEFMDDF